MQTMVAPYTGQDLATPVIPAEKEGNLVQKPANGYDQSA